MKSECPAVLSARTSGVQKSTGRQKSTEKIDRKSFHTILHKIFRREPRPMIQITHPPSAKKKRINIQRTVREERQIHSVL